PVPLRPLPPGQGRGLLPLPRLLGARRAGREPPRRHLARRLDLLPARAGPAAGRPGRRIRARRAARADPLPHGRRAPQGRAGEPRRVGARLSTACPSFPSDLRQGPRTAFLYLTHLLSRGISFLVSARFAWPRKGDRMRVNRWLRIAILLCLGCACASGLWAADWMINEDYKQLDARGASDFDILLQGNVAGQIT